jgi:sugar phosphate isomerase/epimerase
MLERFLHHRLRPEIGLEGTCLYDCPREEFAGVAGALRRANLSCTMHAPFADLAPGAADPIILGASRAKLEKVLELIDLFAPEVIVCHLGYEENKHSFDREGWLERAAETWRRLAEPAAAAGVRLVLENTYETDPSTHLEIFRRLNPPAAGFCLDVGHTLTFARNSWRDWLPALTPWLGHLHLHDNHADGDRHLPVGTGLFDFAGFFAYLRAHDLRPTMTLEAFSEADLIVSLATLDRMELPERP